MFDPNEENQGASNEEQNSQTPPAEEQAGNQENAQEQEQAKVEDTPEVAAPAPRSLKRRKIHDMGA